jgi:hypothetical protein
LPRPCEPQFDPLGSSLREAFSTTFRAALREAFSATFRATLREAGDVPLLAALRESSRVPLRAALRESSREAFVSGATDPFLGLGKAFLAAAP